MKRDDRGFNFGRFGLCQALVEIESLDLVGSVRDRDFD